MKNDRLKERGRIPVRAGVIADSADARSGTTPGTMYSDG
jgi:hypothetical protein